MKLLHYIGKGIAWTGIAAGAAGLTLLTAMAAVLGIVHLESVQHFAVNELEKWFHKRTGGRLEIGVLGGSIPGKMTLDSVFVYGPGELKPVLFARQMTLGILPQSLLGGPIQVTALQADGLKLEIPGLDAVGFLDSLVVSKKTGEEDSPDDRKGLLLPTIGITGSSMLLGPSVLGISEKPVFLENIKLDAEAELLKTGTAIRSDLMSVTITDLSPRPFELRFNVFLEKGQIRILGFQLTNGQSNLELTADLFPRPSAPAQKEAQLSVSSLSVQLDEWKSWIPEAVQKRHFKTLGFSGSARITPDLVRISDSKVTLDGASMTWSGEVTDFSDARKREFSAAVEKLSVPTNMLVSAEQWDSRLVREEKLDFSGSVQVKPNGTDVRGKLLYGGQELDIKSAFDPRAIRDGILANVGFRRLDLGKLSLETVVNTRLNGWIDLKLVPGENLQTTHAKLDIRLLPSRIGEREITSVSWSGNLENGVLTAEVGAKLDAGSFSTTLFADIVSSEKLYLAQGKIEGLDLNRLVPGDVFNSMLLNGRFDFKAQGSSPETFFGSLEVDFDTSFVNKRIVPYHQFYVDLNSPNEAERKFRFVSSMVDLEVSGSFDPVTSVNSFSEWFREVKQQVQKEFLFQKTVEYPWKSIEPVKAAVDFQIKNPQLAADYSAFFNGFRSQGKLSGTVDLTNEEANVRLTYADEKLAAAGVSIFKPSVTLSALIRQGTDLKDRSSISLDVAFDSLQVGKFYSGALKLNLNQFNESARLTTEMLQVAREGRFYADVDVLMAVEALDISFRKMEAGYRNYGWEFVEKAGLIFTEDGKWEFKNFVIKNGEENIQFAGVYSEEPADSVALLLNNVNVKRISDLVKADFTFSGLVNGTFVTRTLLTNPDIRGNLFGEGIRFNNRIVGDITLESAYDSAEERFNTLFNVFTDPAKYGGYLNENKGIGQDITIRGFVKPPLEVKDDDLLFSFQTEVKSFDAWVVNLFLPDLFSTLEAHVSGNISLAGSKSSLQFHGEVDVLSSKIVPHFLNTTYYATGPIIIDRREGIRFNNLNLRDSFNGNGNLTGYIDWNDFKANKALFFEGDMTDMQFLNNFYETDIPFFGTVSGTGKIRLTGFTSAMVLQTVGPCRITPGAQLSLPLLDVEDIEEKTNFIEFQTQLKTDSLTGKEVPAEIPVRPPGSKTFVELFTLNLQFDIPPLSSVKLLFDPVINEAINAEGSGQMAITLEKEVFQLFGRLDIFKGDYLFNGGDLITRRFVLQPGGVISWDGDPVNGYLNARAAYRARPDISPVLPNATLNADNTRNRIFVPLNLIVHMSGPLFQLQNDFFFELESSVATAQDANILTAINSLNNPQTKLIQASALMLTGGFLEDAQTQQQRLGNDFDTKVTQNYFAQLLSNQINTMLNKTVSNVDVSLNMQGFDQFSQTELGVSLRLLDDRLVLRREGQIAGQNAIIGDLGATYRINEYISVEAFHKQDPSQSLFQQNVSAGTQQTINGVGLEAQVQFETWKDFKQKTSDAFRRLVGGKKKTIKPEPVAQGNTP